MDEATLQVTNLLFVALTTISTLIVADSALDSVVVASSCSRMDQGGDGHNHSKQMHLESV